MPGPFHFPNEKPGLEPFASRQDVCLRSPKPHEPIRKPRSPKAGLSFSEARLQVARALLLLGDWDFNGPV